MFLLELEVVLFQMQGHEKRSKKRARSNKFFCVCFLQAFAKVSLCLDKKEVCLNGFLKTIPCIRVATHHCVRQLFWSSQSSTEIKLDILNFYRSCLGSRYRTQIGMCEAEDENKFIIFFSFFFYILLTEIQAECLINVKPCSSLHSMSIFCFVVLFCMVAIKKTGSDWHCV